MSCAVVVFAKAPVAGRAKTRLIPALGPDGAAALAERMLDHSVHQALASGCGPVELCVTPDTTHAIFARQVTQSGDVLRLTDQGEGDLGQRMDRALTRILQQHTCAILIGTDAPALDAEVLRAAAKALQMKLSGQLGTREFRFAGLGLHLYLGPRWQEVGVWKFRGHNHA